MNGTELVFDMIESAGHISISTINARMIKKGYGKTSGGSMVAALVRQKKVKRYITASGKMYAYTGSHLAEGATDLGYKMIKNRVLKADKEQAPEQPAGAVLLTMQWGANRSESVTLNEAREIYGQLKQIFH